MSAVKKQALIEAPVETIWELVGNPTRHSEWWPKVVEVWGERFQEGDEYAQVTRGPIGTAQTNFLVERREELREIGLRCQKTGMFAHWVLTSAQANTFVEVEFGVDPETFGDRVFDLVAGRIYFRRWLEQSVEGLKQAADRSVV
jgi:hypothetical protein